MATTIPTSILVASTALAQTPPEPTPTSDKPLINKYITAGANYKITGPIAQSDTATLPTPGDKGYIGPGGNVGFGIEIRKDKKFVLGQVEFTGAYQDLIEKNFKNKGNGLPGTQGFSQWDPTLRIAGLLEKSRVQFGLQIATSPLSLGQKLADTGLEKGVFLDPSDYQGLAILDIDSGATDDFNITNLAQGGLRLALSMGKGKQARIVSDLSILWLHGEARTTQQTYPSNINGIGINPELKIQWIPKKLNLPSNKAPKSFEYSYEPEIQIPSEENSKASSKASSLNYRRIKLLPTGELNYSHIFFPNALAMIYSDDSIADYETNIPYGNSNNIGGGYGLVLGDRTLELSALIHGGIVGYRSEDSSGLRGLQVDGTLRLGGSPLSWLWIGADSQYIKTLGLTPIKHDTESEVYGGLPVAGAGNEDVWLKGANQIVLNPRVALRIPNSNMQVAAQYSLASLGNNGNGMVWHWTDDNTGDRLQAASHPHSLTVSLAWAPRNISTDINNITQLPVSYHYKIKNNEANRQFLNSLEEVDQQTPENNTFGYEDQGDTLYVTVETGVDKTFDQAFIKKYADYWFTFKNSDGSPTYFFRETNELYGLDTTYIYADLRSQNLDGLADAFESAKKFIQTPEAEPIIDNSKPTQSPSTTSPLSYWDEIQNELSTQITNNLANLPEPQNEQTDEITKEELETLKKEDAEATAEALPRLLEGLKSRDSQIRLNIILLLYNIQPLTEEVKQALITALDDPDQHVRTHAALILGQSKEKAAVPALIDALNDPDPNVRLYASYSLGCIGPDANEAITALTQVSKSDPDENVRSTAEDALKKIKQAQ